MPHTSAETEPSTMADDFAQGEAFLSAVSTFAAVEFGALFCDFADDLTLLVAAGAALVAYRSTKQG